MDKPTWGDLIRRAMTEWDGKLAEKIASTLRFRYHMTHAKSAEFIKKHAPEVDPEELFMKADNAAAWGG